MPNCCSGQVRLANSGNLEKLLTRIFSVVCWVATGNILAALARLLVEVPRPKCEN